MKKSKFYLASIALCVGLISCNKVKNGEVITDTYTGTVMVTSAGSDPGGNFTGSGDNGTYAFGWENTKAKAEVNFDITTPTGSVQMILEDKNGTEVLNEMRSAGGTDTFSGTSAEGKPGVWTVTIVFIDFNGDGSYSLSPID